jgi:CHAD domain-containing protein
METIRFHLHSKDSENALYQDLTEQYTVQNDPREDGTVHYFDSFDWRLYKNGLKLIGEEGHYKLAHLNEDQPILTTQADLVTFWWDCPNVAMRNRLASILDVRALIKIASLQQVRHHQRILNRDQKTVLRMSWEQIDGAGESIRLLQIQPVRGYDRYTDDITSLCVKHDLKPLSTILYKWILERLGHRPGAYSSKVHAKLSPTMPAAQALRIIYRQLFEIMTLNIPGLKQDIDTEFLHDFRTSIRRTRSGLSQLVTVFPENKTKTFRDRFKKLGKASNRLRDLDVYLNQREAYQDRLPHALRDGLAPLFKELERERRHAHKALVTELDSEETRSLLTEWDALLNAESERGASASTPIVDLAKKTIKDRYQHVLEKGKAINDASPSQDLHRLRIQCKKLRYLLEFFSSLFPGHEINHQINQLKHLQDNLGLYNDLSVQITELTTWLEHHASSARNPVHVAAALGGLVSLLNRERKTVREKFNDTFTAFSRPENQKMLFRLVS